MEGRWLQFRGEFCEIEKTGEDRGWFSFYAQGMSKKEEEKRIRRKEEVEKTAEEGRIPRERGWSATGERGGGGGGKGGREREGRRRTCVKDEEKRWDGSVLKVENGSGEGRVKWAKRRKGASESRKSII